MACWIEFRIAVGLGPTREGGSGDTLERRHHDPGAERATLPLRAPSVRWPPTCQRSAPMTGRITVVDNGSTDRTWSLANSFAAENSHTRAIRLDRPGRGGALKEAWSTSSADVVAYMDVDLSTGLGVPATIARTHRQRRSRHLDRFSPCPRCRSSNEACSARSSRGSTTSSLEDFFDTRSVTLNVDSRQSGPALPETSSRGSRMMAGSSIPNSWFSRGGTDCASTRYLCVGSRTMIPECGS